MILWVGDNRKESMLWRMGCNTVSNVAKFGIKIHCRKQTKPQRRKQKTVLKVKPRDNKNAEEKTY